MVGHKNEGAAWGWVVAMRKRAWDPCRCSHCAARYGADVL